MNLDRNKAFEEQLRSIRPVPHGPRLENRIAEAIRIAEARQRTQRWRARMAWVGVAMAASVLIVSGLSLFRENRVPSVGESVVADPLEVPPAESAEPVFEPVLAQNNLQDRVDEGIVFLKNGLTARKYRYKFIDRVVWRNPANGAVVDVEVPRDEVVLIPVQTY